ncbi:CRE-RPL-9 protein [Neoconidiobolus thromboides FSU 785]|nr:CRE-RPL-9 protein [Neoconidiobolus thromboides FSU 785]
MKDIYSEEIITIPEGVTVHAKSRIVKVTGPRGTLSRDYKHIQLELQRAGKNKIKVIVWHAGRKHLACIGTISSSIKNMIKGVTKGFLYKLRFVYSHFPINVTIADDGKKAEIRNYLGEKRNRSVVIKEGVTIEHSKDVKDELIIFGNDINDVSQTAASFQQSTLARNKDIRKFLDGIYISGKTTVVQDD